MSPLLSRGDVENWIKDYADTVKIVHTYVKLSANHR